MRIEILVGNDDPIIFPLNSLKVSLGSAENNDICLKAQGVSRKHISIITEGDQYYIIDQGSTNGTFINEERIIPGRRVEFTSFFPVRLGDNVLISLLSDEEELGFSTTDFNRREISSPSINAPASSHDTTTVISLKDLTNARTEKLLRKRENKRKEIQKRSQISKPAANKEKRKFNLSYIGAVVIFIGAAYYNLFLDPPVDDHPVISKVGEVVPVSVTSVPFKEASYKIESDNLISYEKLSNLRLDIKCVTELEKYLCDNIPDMPGEAFWGVTQVGLMLNVLQDGSKYLEMAKKIIGPPRANSSTALDESDKHLREVSALLYLLDGIPQNLDYERLKEVNITFALFYKSEDKYEPYVAIAVRPEGLKQYKETFKPHMLKALKVPNSDLMENAKKYLNIY